MGLIPVSATRFFPREFLRATSSRSYQSVLCNGHLSGRFQKRLLTARGNRGHKQGYKGSYSKELPPSSSHRYYHPWCPTRQQIQKIIFVGRGLNLEVIPRGVQVRIVSIPAIGLLIELYGWVLAGGISISEPRTPPDIGGLGRGPAAGPPSRRGLELRSPGSQETGAEWFENPSPQAPGHAVPNRSRLDQESS